MGPHRLRRPEFRWVLGRRAALASKRAVLPIDPLLWRMSNVGCTYKTARQALSCKGCVAWHTPADPPMRPRPGSSSQSMRMRLLVSLRCAHAFCGCCTCASPDRTPRSALTSFATATEDLSAKQAHFWSCVRQRAGHFLVQMSLEDPLVCTGPYRGDWEAAAPSRRRNGGVLRVSWR